MAENYTVDIDKRKVNKIAACFGRMNGTPESGYYLGTALVWLFSRIMAGNHRRVQITGGLTKILRHVIDSAGSELDTAYIVYCLLEDETAAYEWAAACGMKQPPKLPAEAGKTLDACLEALLKAVENSAEKRLSVTDALSIITATTTTAR